MTVRGWDDRRKWLRDTDNRSMRLEARKGKRVLGR